MVIGQGPRSAAQAAVAGSSGNGKETFSCASVLASRASKDAGLLATASFLGLAIVRARRKRR
jgi:hypothetical protein